MEFSKVKKAVCDNAKSYEKKYKVKIDENTALLKLMEEVGEFMQSVLIYKNKCRPEKKVSKSKAKEELANELSDVVGVAMIIADIYNIDLEKAINKKWIGKK